jgi:PAS domain S-box-containing protein
MRKDRMSGEGEDNGGGGLPEESGEFPQARDGSLLLRICLESHPDAVLLTDTKRRILLSNPAASRLFGYSRGELVGNSARLLYGTDEEYAEAGRGRYPAPGRPLIESRELRFRKRDGAEFFAEVSGSAVRDEEGGLAGYLAVVRDITERRQLQELRERTGHELEKRVGERTEELRILTQALSHDLRNPLVAVAGFANLLQRVLPAEGSGKAREYAARIQDATQWMQALLNDLMELLTAQHAELRIETLDLGEVVAKVVDVNRGFLEEKGVEVTTPPEFPRVRADERLLRRVIENILQNAAKYFEGEKSPHIQIGAECAGDVVTVTVRDNGMGIAPEDQERIFKRFERGPGGAGGSGLGLAIARRFVGLHGGTIWVESEGRGRGSAFRFTLPAA